MANARIDIIGHADLAVIADLYKQIFKPAHEVDFFKRRFLGRHNGLILVASLETGRWAFIWALSSSRRCFSPG